MVSLEYLAGFFDGEGSITVCGGKTKYSLRVICANMVKEAVEPFHEKFGGGMYLIKHKNNPNWKDCWRWQCNSRQAEVCIRAMLPHLRVKRRAAELALELYSLMPNTGKGCYKPRVTPEVRAKRDRVVSLLHEVNRRGVN